MEPAPFWHYGKEISEELDDYLIAHAGAAIENNTYTNSREALQNAKRLGYRFVELDLQVLADGTIVGAHDAPPVDLQTWEKFSAQPIKGKFTPIALPEICDFFRSNPDMWLVTDKISQKQDLEKFLEVWGEDHGNLVVEVFSPRQWVDARKLGIRLPALNVRHGRELKALRYFNIPVATCDRRLIMEYPHETEEYLKAGGSLLVFTENDAFTARQNLSRRATLLYTDYLVPAHFPTEGQ